MLRYLGYVGAGDGGICRSFNWRSLCCRLIIGIGFGFLDMLNDLLSFGHGFAHWFRRLLRCRFGCRLGAGIRSGCWRLAFGVCFSLLLSQALGFQATFADLAWIVERPAT